MTFPVLRRPVLWFVVLAPGLVAVQLFAAGRPLPAADAHALAIAVTVDLVVGLPLLGYVVLSRRAGWPPLVAAPLFLLGLLLARLLVPDADGPARQVLEYLALAVEALIVASVMFKARSLRRGYVEQRPGHVYGFEALRQTLTRVFPGDRTADIVASEMATMGLAVLGWRRSYTAPDRATVFPYLQRSGYTSVFVAVLVAMAIEAVGVHLLVDHWWPTTAWVVTGLTVYSMVWLTGDYHALRLAPHVVRDGRLHLRVGLRLAADVPLGLVDRVQPWTPRATTDQNFVAFGVPQVVLVLRDAVVVRGLFGRRRDARTLGVAVDDVARFMDVVRPGDPGDATTEDVPRG